MAGNFGWSPGYGSSSRRRVHVLRGFNGCDPQTFTKSREVASGEQIFSGQIMSLNTSGKWVKGQSSAGKTCYIALSNFDDTDVRASNKLPGLSCSGEFEIETPWYVSSGSTYQEDLTRLIAAGAGDEGNVVDDGGTGDVDTIIGKVTKAPYKLNDVNLSTGTAEYPFSSNELGNSEVIAFITVQD